MPKSKFTSNRQRLEKAALMSRAKSAKPTPLTIPQALPYSPTDKMPMREGLIVNRSNPLGAGAVSPHSVLRHTYGDRLPAVISAANEARRVDPTVKVLQQLPDASKIDTDPNFNRRVRTAVLPQAIRQTFLQRMLAGPALSPTELGTYNARQDSILVRDGLTRDTALHHENTHAMQGLVGLKAGVPSGNDYQYFSSQPEIEAFVSEFNSKFPGLTAAERIKEFDQAVDGSLFWRSDDSRAGVYTNPLVRFIRSQDGIRRLKQNQGIKGFDKQKDQELLDLRDRARSLIPLIVQQRRTGISKVAMALVKAAATTPKI